MRNGTRTFGTDAVSRSWKAHARRELSRHGVIDAHHHSVSQAQRGWTRTGFWDWLSQSYLAFLAEPAGTAADRLWDDSAPEDERLDLLIRFLKMTRATTYYQIVRRGLLTAFDFDINQLDRASWRDLDARISEASQAEDWSFGLLRREMNQVSGVLDKHAVGTLADALTAGTFDWYEYILNVRPHRDNKQVNAKTVVREIDRRLTRAAVKIDSLFYGYLPCVRDELDQLLLRTPETFTSLESYLNYVDDVLDHCKSDGDIVALKSAIAGVRTLDFTRADRRSAEAVFTLKPQQLTPEQARNFENYLMHHLCNGAGARALPFQLHVAAGPGGYQADSACRPGLLTPLILEHPRTKFDLMHAGYPHWGECGMLAARFPNVYLNLSWSCMISASDLRRMLDSWIDQLPANKIMWGGDWVYAEETLGVFLVCRDQMITVLADKIAKGWMEPDAATSYLKGAFCDNARLLFGLMPRGTDESPEGDSIR